MAFPLIMYGINNSLSIFIVLPEGRKLCILQNCNQASFCVVGRTRVVSNQFSTEYESIVINGTMICQLEETEKRKALELLLDKYSPEDKKGGVEVYRKVFSSYPRLETCY